MSLLVLALLVAAIALAGRLAQRPWVDRTQALVAATVGAHLLATRRPWEDAVRRPLWLVDAARGVWLDRGVDWLLTALALALATSLLASSSSARLGSALRLARGATLTTALLAAAALAWATVTLRG